jgi:NDP-sugar pyrophosphorylase family protein
MELLNKTILLNGSKLDIGNLSGIQIYGNNTSIGYIRTNTTASRFEIKTPVDITSNYITVIDNNYNLNISGSSILQNNVSIFSNLYISSVGIINDLSINANMNISSSTILKNLYVNNTINVSSNSILNGSLNINKLNISNLTIIKRPSDWMNIVKYRKKIYYYNIIKQQGLTLNISFVNDSLINVTTILDKENLEFTMEKISQPEN